MTTIAVRDGVLAADTLFTCNGSRDHYTTKAWRIGGVLAAACGPSTHIHAFRSWVVGGMEGPSPYAGASDSGNGIVVAPGHPIILAGSGGLAPVIADFYALGSGESFAIGAMEMGATAEEAVRIAAKRDTATGGEITVLSLAKPDERTKA